MTLNKYICQLLIGWLMLLTNSLVSTEYVPVYIWESAKSNEIVPALPWISQETFKEIIQEKLNKKSLVLIFAEPNLSSEDFGEVDNSGEKVFSHLPNIEATTTYLPFVDDPINVIKNIHNNDVSRTTIKDFNVKNIKTSLLIVDLDDVQDNETRNEILQRHDKSIYDIYKTLEEKEDVIAIYTGYHTSWITPEEVELSRQTRNVLQVVSKPERDTSDWHVFSTENFLLFVRSRPILTYRSNEISLANHTVSSTVSNSSLIVNLTADGEAGIEMVFSFGGGYWTFTNLFVVPESGNREQLKVSDIFAPAEFSFQCNVQSFYNRNDSTTNVTFPGMQLQAFRARTNRTFGDPYYCVGFTTAPIWSGIFVTAILVTIMAIGLSMMMDIRTMDRFDDPKGKTIQINVSE